MRRYFAGLRVRLLLIVFLATLPGAVLMLHTAAEQRQAAEIEARETAMRLVRMATSNQIQVIEGAHQLLVALSALPAVQARGSAACTAFFSDLMVQYPLYANLWAVDAETGEVFCSGLPMREQVNVSTAPYYLQTLEARGFTGGEYSREPADGLPVMPFGYPAPAGREQPTVVVFAGLDVRWLYQFAAEAGLSSGLTLSVFDHNGMILTRYPEPDDWVGTNVSDEVLQAHLEGEEGAAQGMGIDGTQQIYAYKVLCCLASGNVYVRVDIPVEAAFAEANRALRRNLLTLGAASAFTLLAAWFGGNATVVREVRSLVLTTKRLAAGDYGARTGLAGHAAELGELALSLDQMAGVLERREIEREEAEETLRRHGARTEALARGAGRLNTRLDLESALNTVCIETAAALGVAASSVALFDSHTATLSCAASCGLAKDSCGRTQSVKRAGEEVVAPSDEQGQLSELPIAALYANAGMPMVASVLMTRDGELVGCLTVFEPEDTPVLDADELALLRGLADQAALAISNARLYEALQHEQRVRAGLLASVISAQEEERKRIARELHDETSQDLNALILAFDCAHAALKGGATKADAHISTGKAIAQATLESVHRLVRNLRPSVLDDLGLVPAINWYGEERLKPLGVAITFECHGLTKRLPAAMETMLFRIAQEAITNVARHSEATEVHVTLSMDSRQVRLEVKDNGKGFDMSSISPLEQGGRGLGLRGMQERVALLGGECSVQSEIGKGTVIAVKAPLTP